MKRPVRVIIARALVLCLFSWGGGSILARSASPTCTMLVGYVFKDNVEQSTEASGSVLQYVRTRLRPLIERLKLSEQQVRSIAQDPTKWAIYRNDEELSDVIRSVTVSPQDSVPVASLLLNSDRLNQLKDDDKLVVAFKLDNGTLVCHGNETENKVVQITFKKAPAPHFTWTFNPQQATGTLIDGSTKALVQAPITFDYPLSAPPFNILKDDPLRRLDLKGDDLLSTDSSDTATKIKFILHYDQNMVPSWYLPWQIDLSYVANQLFSQTSVHLASGVEASIPWGWTKSIFWNDVIKAPIAPHIKLAADNMWTLQQDSRLTQSHPNPNQLLYTAEIGWYGIHLFSSKGESPVSPDDVTLEIKAKVWYFPSESATGGHAVQQWESGFEASLLIPLGQGAANIIGTDKRPQLRIRYVSMPQETNGFKLEQGLKIGIDLSL